MTYRDASIKILEKTLNRLGLLYSKTGLEPGTVLKVGLKERPKIGTVEGPFKLTPVMVRALKAQKTIYEQHRGESFFCSLVVSPIYPSNLRRKVWIPALERACIKF